MKGGIGRFGCFGLRILGFGFWQNDEGQNDSDRIMEGQNDGEETLAVTTKAFPFGSR
jgi:hypothetical protein